MRLPFTFSCPACRAAGQRFPIYQAIERKTCTRCSSCGSEVVSELGYVAPAIWHVLSLMALATLGLIFVASILTAQWFWGIAALIAQGVLTWMPGMYLHSRNATLPVVNERPKRYGRKQVS